MLRRLWIGFALFIGCAHQPTAEPLLGQSQRVANFCQRFKGSGTFIRQEHPETHWSHKCWRAPAWFGTKACQAQPEASLWGVRPPIWTAHIGRPLSLVIRTPVVNLVQGDDSWAWPDGLLDTLKGLAQPGDDVGLVRARRGDEDVWVGLIGRPPFLLAPLNKEVEPGAQIRIQNVDSSSLRYTLVSPTGQMQQGALPVSLTLAQVGEWWIEIKQEPNDGQLGLPIYVGMKTPDVSLLELPGRAVASEQGAMAEAEVLLQQIRDDFGLGPLLEDGTLSALAQRPLEEQMAGQWDAIAGVERLHAAGFVGEGTAQVSCMAETVAACLSDILEQAKPRAALLQRNKRFSWSGPRSSRRCSTDDQFGSAMKSIWPLLCCWLLACAPKAPKELVLAQKTSGPPAAEVRYRMQEAPNQMAQNAMAHVDGSVWDGGLQRAVEELLSLTTHRSFSLDPRTTSLVAARAGFPGQAQFTWVVNKGMPIALLQRIPRSSGVPIHMAIAPESSVTVAPYGCWGGPKNGPISTRSREI